MQYIKKTQVLSNASWIIVCRIIQAVLNLAISMMVARYFGPTNYGIINYAAAVVAFFVPIMQLGLRSTLVHEYIDESNDEGEVLGTATVLSVTSSILCVIGVALFVLISNGNERETILVSLLYSIVLIFQATEMIQYWFQAKLLSKYTSIVSLGAYIVVSAYKVFLLVSKKSIYWFAVSNALDFFIISVGLFYIYKKVGTRKLSFSLNTAKKLLRRSKYYIVSSMMVTVFGYIGSIMLDFYMDKEAVGLYTAAITCAGMTSFVFNALIDTSRPVILSYKQTDEKKYQQGMITLCSVIFYVSLIQSIVICVAAKLVVSILYGSAYLECVNSLRIIAWYTIFSYLGPVRNIWILAEEKQKYLWIINLSGAIVSTVLNIILIPRIGVLGASIAAVGTQFFANFLVGYFIKPIRPCNILMLKGFNPKHFFFAVKNIIKF